MVALLALPSAASTAVTPSRLLVPAAFGQRNHQAPQFGWNQSTAPAALAAIGIGVALRRTPKRRRGAMLARGSSTLPDFPGGGPLEPLSFVAGEQAVGPSCKTLHLMRHGEALVNAAGRVFPKGDPRKSAVRQDPKFFDSPLSEKGMLQSAALGAGTLDGRDDPPQVELVVCSPLTRAIQTATAVFAPKGSADEQAAGSAPRLYVLEALREFCGKNFQPCDQRRMSEELAATFPHADLKHVPSGKDELLGPGRVEGPESADARIQWLLAWLRERPETNIGCVAHMQILTRLLTKHLEPAGFDGSSYGDLDNLEVRSVPIRFD
mmetsp:Transcript_9738/g.18795  ORF Transcript_9738/g.18795 Transcript_9738/m.18795 type:complete len:322 (-) Transcript_9738:49-1014(-)